MQYQECTTPKNKCTRTHALCGSGVDFANTKLARGWGCTGLCSLRAKEQAHAAQETTTAQVEEVVDLGKEGT